MMDQAFVESLIRALDESSLDSLELEREGTRLRLSKSPNLPFASSASPAVSPILAPPAPDLGQAGPNPTPSKSEPAPVSAEPEMLSDQEGLLEVTSPMVGTFYAAPAPDAAPYVEVGQRVGNGTVLCIIEAMKLMNELESEVEGTIVKIMVENAQPVEYGQVLFLIDPS
ncbi:MAG: acetyl-CoA carboxylase biotin carboxyl carrier protein [Gemmatimonadota bacterium]|jgi:acetyl-CoA carboxylase biotin carboxyl carrier protein